MIDDLMSFEEMWVEGFWEVFGLVAMKQMCIRRWVTDNKH